MRCSPFPKNILLTYTVRLHSVMRRQLVHTSQLPPRLVVLSHLSGEMHLVAMHLNGMHLISIDVVVMLLAGLQLIGMHLILA